MTTEKEIEEDGIYGTDETCGCGSNLRLHVHTFAAGRKYYVDCARCGNVSVWKTSPDEALKAFKDEVEPDLPDGVWAVKDEGETEIGDAV